MWIEDDPIDEIISYRDFETKVLQSKTPCVLEYFAE